MENSQQPAPNFVGTKNKCCHLPLILLLIVVALGSLGFAAYEILQNNKKDGEIKDLKTSIQAQAKESGTPISNSEAEAILEKYIGKTGLLAMGITPAYKVFMGEYDDELKLELAYSSLDHVGQNNTEGCKDGHTKYTEYNWCNGSVKYDTLNKAYVELFGDYSVLEKKNQYFGKIMSGDKSYYHTYLDYIEETDSFDVYVSGIGGTTTVSVVRKVVSVKEKDGNMIATVVYGEIDTSLETKKEIEAFLEDHYKLYEFTLSPYEDTYVLTAVNVISE